MTYTKTIYDKYIEAVNSMQAPGESPTLIVIFDNVGRLHTSNGILVTEKQIEDFVNYTLIPYAFVNGIFCSGIHHGSFVTNRKYDKAVDIPHKGEEDYSFDYDLLNYVHSVMVAANEYREGKNLVTLITYSSDMGTSIVTEFKDEYDFTLQTKDEMEYFEENLN